LPCIENAEIRFSKDGIGYRALVRRVYESAHFVHIDIYSCRQKPAAARRCVWKPADYTRLDLSEKAERVKNVRRPLVIVDHALQCRIWLGDRVEDAPLPAPPDIPLSRAGTICLVNREGVPVFVPTLVDEVTGSYVYS
jgi:hypothetical protein